MEFGVRKSKVNQTTKRKNQYSIKIIMQSKRILKKFLKLSKSTISVNSPTAEQSKKYWSDNKEHNSDAFQILKKT